MFRRAFLGDSSIRPRSAHALLDLRVAFQQAGPATYAGLDLTAVVPCELLSWQRTSTGQWMAWVQVQLTYEPGGTYNPQHIHLHTLVAGAALRPAP